VIRLFGGIFANRKPDEGVKAEPTSQLENAPDPPELGEAKELFDHVRANPADLQAVRQMQELLGVLSSQGNGHATRLMADSFRDGIGYPLDKAKARALYELAIAQRYADAEYPLGKMLVDGVGGDKDWRRGITLIEAYYRRTKLPAVKSQLAWLYAEHEDPPHHLSDDEKRDFRQWRDERQKVAPGLAAAASDEIASLALEQGFPSIDFLLSSQRLFGHDIAYYKTGVNGEGERKNFNCLLKALDRARPEDCLRALYILSNSVLWEQRRRGFPTTDEKGQARWPYMDPEHGFLVEEIEQDDGSTLRVFARDVEAIIPAAELEEFVKRRVSLGHSLVWRGYLSDFTINTPNVSRLSSRNDAFPLFRLEMHSVVVRLHRANPFAPPNTEYGAAQFAWSDELKASKQISFYESWESADQHTETGAMLGFFDASLWDEGNPTNGNVVAEGGHRILVGPPGSGKFTTAIAPLLLTADAASAFVFDVADGEAARTTAAWRAKFGPVHVIDPFGVTGLETASLNPLDLLRPEDPNILQAAQNLTDALFVVSPGDATQGYFNDQARGVLTSYLLHVATFRLEKERTLRRVRELIRKPLTPDLLAAMQLNPIAGGFVADTAANLIAAIESKAERNTFFVTQTLRANTAFLDLPAVVEATKASSFDPRQLRQQVSTVYVCLPEAQLNAVGRWLRLIYAMVMEQVRGERDQVPLHVVIDEFPAMGRFPRVKDDMALVRKFGIRMHITTQSLAQLKGLYGDDWESFMSAAKFQQLLGANDELTARYFSARLGKTTRRSTSSQRNQTADSGSQAHGSSWHAEDLMSPDEIGRLHPDDTIVVVEGMNPLRLLKLHYFTAEAINARAMTGKQTPSTEDS